MSHLSLDLLGTFVAKLDDQVITGFESDKVRALLIFLVVERDRPHHRETLSGILWPDMPEQNARTNLRNVLANLRKVLGDRTADVPFLLVTRQTLQFNPASDASVDVWDLVKSTERAILELEDVVERYKGEFLAGFSLDSDLYDSWISSQRESLHIHVLNVLHSLAEYAEHSGQRDKAIRYAQAQIALEPWRESAHRRLMRIYAENEQRAVAIAQYASCKRVLQEELGITPEPETMALYAQISRCESREEPKGRLGVEAQAAHHPPGIPNNLPNHVSLFIGRQDLLRQVQHYLIDDKYRLLTLLGPGGSGKTRLAQEVGRALVKGHDRDCFGDGIYFVSLAAVETSQGIIPAIAHAINLTFVGESEPDKQLTAYLSNKRMLLILDNFEHLISGTEIVIAWLQASPNLKVVVTTRIKPNIPIEQVIAVPGMAYPDDADSLVKVEDYSGLLLFQHFARRVQSEFAIDEHNLRDVAKICQLVHGMPLGMLLASAWMNMLSPREIANEIEHSLDFLSNDWLQVPARQRSMRAMFEHSWRLLPVNEQRKLASLAVFTGGWTRDAALAVAKVTSRDLLILINKSLIQRLPDGRYSMHELIRQFVAEKLNELSELLEQIRLAHGRYFRDRLRIWHDELRSPRYNVAMHEIEPDLANAHAAINNLVEYRQLHKLELSLDGLGYYYRRKGLLPDGIRFFLNLLDRLDVIDQDEVSLVHAKAFQQLSVIHHHMGQMASAVNAIDQGLGCFQLTFEQALKLHHKGLPSDSHQRRGLADVLVSLAMIHERGDPPRIRHLYALSHRIYVGLRDTWFDAFTLHLLADTYIVCYQRGIARKIYDWSHNLYAEANDPMYLMISSLNSAGWFSSYGDWDIGNAYLKRAECVANQHGLQKDRSYRSALARIYNVQGKYAECLELRLELQEENRQAGTQHKLYESSPGIAQVLTQLGQYERSLTLLKKAYQYFNGIQASVLEMRLLLEMQTASLGAGKVQQAQNYYRKTVTLKAVNGVYAYEVLDFYPLIAFHLKRYDEMLEPLLAGLRHTLSTHDMIDMLCYLTMVSVFLLTSAHGKRAVEVYALANSHAQVSSNIWFEDVAGKFVKQAAASLPPDVVAAAQARGRELDVWQTAEALIGELEELAETQDR